jgi:hypothetical protein
MHGPTCTFWTNLTPFSLQRIFADPPSAPVQLDANATMARVRTSTPHGFKVADRFRVSGAKSFAYNGGWSVCAVVDPHTFSYSMLHAPPDGLDGGSPELSHAVWYLSRQEWVTPEWWGAADSVWADSTVAVQSAIDSGNPGVLLLMTYQVSRITLVGSGRLLEGRGVGGFTAMTNARPNPKQLAPPGVWNAVFEIKTQFSQIRNLGVVAAYNGTYTAAVHWYTNDLSIWGVEFNKIFNLHIDYAKIGFLIGATPNQDPKYFPTPGQDYPFSGVAPDGVAVNAPLSESYIEGLNLRGTEKGFYMNQPNGVLHVSNSFLYASDQEWPVTATGAVPSYDWSLACPLELHDDFDILITSTDLELNQNGEWSTGATGLRIANVTGGGRVGFKDTCIEAQGSFVIGGNAQVTWNGNDDGYSSMPVPVFEIRPEATGSLLMRNAVWNRPTGWGINLPILFISRQITAAHPDSLFTATLDGVTLRDFTWDVTGAPGLSGGGPGGKWPNGCLEGGASPGWYCH